MRTPLASEIDITTTYPCINGQHAGHRSPEEAGGADRYYGRPFSPNFAYNGHTFTKDHMTAEQIEQYTEGFNNETDRKDWGAEESEYGND